MLNVVRAQNLCVFASTDAVVFDSKSGIFFFAVQSFDGSGPRDVIYTFDPDGSSSISSTFSAR